MRHGLRTIYQLAALDQIRGIDLVDGRSAIDKSPTNRDFPDGGKCGCGIGLASPPKPSDGMMGCMTHLLVNIGTTASQSGWIDNQLIGACVQSAAVVLAAWFGFRAITKQIRESESRRLKSELLEHSLESARSLSDAASEATSLLTRLMLEIDVHSKATAAGIDSPIPSIRFSSILEIYEKFSNATLDLIFLVEARQFIEPKLLVFRDALLCVLHDGSGVIYRDFPTVVMQSLPTDKPDGGIYPYTPPTLEAAEAVKTFCQRALNVVSNGQCVATDFQVEMQNLLASDLFGHRVEHRVPLDPKHQVFRIETADQQRAWLNTETDWGKECARIDAETRRNVAVAQGDVATPPAPPAPSPPP